MSASVRIGPGLALIRSRAQPPPRLVEAIERVTSLEPAYARAVRRIIARGSPLAQELLLRPVDAARERVDYLLAQWSCQGNASDRDVIEGHNALARLMEMVIGEGR